MTIDTQMFFLGLALTLIGICFFFKELYPAIAELNREAQRETRDEKKIQRAQSKTMLWCLILMFMIPIGFTLILRSILTLA